MNPVVDRIVNPVLGRAAHPVVRLDLVVVVRDGVWLFSAPMSKMTLDLLGVLVLRKIPLVLHAFLQWGEVESLLTRRGIVKNLP